MSDKYVREVGRIVDPDSSVVIVGVDCDAVTVTAAGWAAGGVRLAPAQQEEFAQLLVAAVWQAGRNAALMAGDPS